jgi:hypothetical protein
MPYFTANMMMAGPVMILILSTASAIKTECPRRPAQGLDGGLLGV